MASVTFLNNFKFYVYGSLPYLYVFTPLACLIPMEARRGSEIQWNRSYCTAPSAGKHLYLLEEHPVPLTAELCLQLSALLHDRALGMRQTLQITVPYKCVLGCIFQISRAKPYHVNNRRVKKYFLEIQITHKFPMI